MRLGSGLPTVSSKVSLNLTPYTYKISLIRPNFLEGRCSIQLSYGRSVMRSHPESAGLARDADSATKIHEVATPFQAPPSEKPAEGLCYADCRKTRWPSGHRVEPSIPQSAAGLERPPGAASAPSCWWGPRRPRRPPAARHRNDRGRGLRADGHRHAHAAAARAVPHPELPGGLHHRPPARRHHPAQAPPGPHVRKQRAAVLARDTGADKPHSQS